MGRDRGEGQAGFSKLPDDSAEFLGLQMCPPLYLGDTKKLEGQKKMLTWHAPLDVGLFPGIAKLARAYDFPSDVECVVVRSSSCRDGRPWVQPPWIMCNGSNNG